MEKAKIANIAAIIGGIYSVYAVYGCGWTVILEGAFVTAMGFVIYAIVSPKLRYTTAQSFPAKGNTTVRTRFFCHATTPSRIRFISSIKRLLSE